MFTSYDYGPTMLFKAIKIETFCATDVSAVYLPLLPSRGMHLWKGIVCYYPIRKEQTAWLLAIRETEIHIYAKRQINEFVPCDQISPVIVVYCLLLLLKNKQFHASFIHKNIIVVGSFYLFIFSSEKFSTWIWRLLLAVNVTFNLSTVTGRHTII